MPATRVSPQGRREAEHPGAQHEGRPMPLPAPAPSPGPQLELSGPKLRQAFAALIASAEEHGGIERYVEALRVKSALFREFLGDGKARTVENGALKALCA